MRTRWVKICILTAAPVLLAAAVYCRGVVYLAQRRADKLFEVRRPETAIDRTFKVKRDNLNIGLRLSGNVSASEKHKLSLQANYPTKLLSVVDENARVRKGDVLAVFETDELKEKIDDLRISFSDREKELAIAIEDAKVQESTNELDLKVAEDRLNQAEAALRKYLRLERSNNRKNLAMEIATAETNLLNAQQTYNDRQKAIKEESVNDEDQEQQNQQELLDLQNKIDTAENALSSAKTVRKAFQRYDNPTNLLRLHNELEQAKLNREQVRISTASKLVQKKKQVENLRINLRKLVNQLEKYESYLPMMKLIAPADGIVIYADPDRRWGNPDVKPGMDIWKGQIILTIPAMSNLMVDFDLPEQYRSRIHTGNRVVITPDSLPTLKISGTISHIATLPVNQISWDSASPKVYNSRVTLDAQNPQLVNGMSVEVEVISKVLRDVLFVPVEAVFENDSSFYVYCQKGGEPKEVPVVIGEANSNYVQILDGLRENDTVYLYRPYQKKQEDES